MKPLRMTCTLVVLMLLAALNAPAGEKDKEKDQAKVVDSGSFGIFVGGKRVATETFQITEKPEGSLAHSEFKVADGSSSQSSDLQLLPSGDLRRYEWRDNGSKALVVVELKNDFLVEQVTLADATKPTEVPFLLSASTSVLDDNFFVHRQILAWKYLASGCAPGTITSEGCVYQKAQFGVIVPQQQRPMVMNMEYAGKDKLPGGERELWRFKLETEGVEWILWLDDQRKMVRVLVAAQNIEVRRD